MFTITSLWKSAKVTTWGILMMEAADSSEKPFSICYSTAYIVSCPRGHSDLCSHHENLTSHKKYKPFSNRNITRLFMAFTHNLLVNLWTEQNGREQNLFSFHRSFGVQKCIIIQYSVWWQVQSLLQNDASI